MLEKWSEYTPDGYLQLRYDLLRNACLGNPLRGPSEAEFQAQHLFQSVPSLRRVRHDVPAGLAEIIRKMTEKPINLRFASVSEIEEILEKQNTAQKKKVIDVSGILNAVNRHNEKDAKVKATRLGIEEEEKVKDQLRGASIDNLFHQFQVVVDILNERLIDQKFYLGAPRVLGMLAHNKELRISFEKIGLVLEFAWFDRDNYIKQKRQMRIDRQKQHYGFVVQDPVKSYIELDKVTAIGQVYLIYAENSRHPGFNVVLVHSDPEDIYRFWCLSKFDDAMYRPNSTPFSYPLSLNEFAAAFEIGRSGAMHVRSMGFRKYYRLT